MPVYAWVSLGVFVAAVAPAGALAAVAVARLLRSARTASQPLRFALARLESRTEVLAGRMEHAAARMAEVEGAAKTLAGSRARLDTLLFALRDVRALVALARTVAAPRK